MGGPPFAGAKLYPLPLVVELPVDDVPLIADEATDGGRGAGGSAESLLYDGGGLGAARGSGSMLTVGAARPIGVEAREPAELSLRRLPFIGAAARPATGVE